MAQDYHRSQRGFSLVEALVVLTVSAVLMSIFSRVYLSAERSYRHMEAYAQDNRDAFYAREQVRAWLSGITVPYDYGRTEDAVATSGFFASQAELPPPFRGNRTSMEGFLRDPI